MKNERDSMTAEGLHRRRRALHPRGVRIVSAIALCALGAACTAEIGGTLPKKGAGAALGSSAGGGNTPVDTQHMATGATADLGLPPGAAPVASLHKLTAAEFANSVHDLLGSDAPLSAVEPDSIVSGFSTVGAGSVAISPAGVGLYETATGSATEFAFADATHAGKVLPCVPADTNDSTCINQALTAFGRRAFRRPLTSDEVSRFATLATSIGNESGSSILVGMRHAVWAILQSPSFLYRVELGAPSSADGGRIKYSSWEMASRLAGVLWASVPDDTLLDLAAKDGLSTADAVRTQAQRLLADPNAHRAVQSFTDDLYGLQLLDEASKDPAVFPKFTSTLPAEMRTELEQRIDDMVFTTKGDFLSLYDDRSTFVNQELAAYYGLPAPSGTGFGRVAIPSDSPRAGLLGAGAILVAYGLPQRTSPTSRGKFVLSSFLCKDVPPPPPGVPPLPAMAAANATMRERMTVHRADPSCSSCHALMDPIGFGMENFDSAAQYRTLDNGSPIDATGTLTDGTPFSDLASLGSALRNEAVAGPCFVSKVYASALGRTALDLDGAAISALATKFASSGNHADELLLDVIASDSFRFVQPGTGN